MARNALPPILFSLLVAGCTGSSDPVDPHPTDFPLGIRVENATGQTFEAITVQFSEQIENYGKLEAGEASEYRAIEEAYRYAAVDIDLGSTTARIQPVDYVGETLLQPGRYTYRFTLSPDGFNELTRVNLRLVVD
ncbi:MAG: hypothetical protein ABFS14_05800 [Gemmatimonadota bacterium]